MFTSGPLAEPRAPRCASVLCTEGGTVLTQSASLSYFLSLSLELGSCRASEKGGDFLSDKHVINLREHILSHRKITEGETSKVVTQTALQIVVILNTCTIQQIDLFPL